MAIFEVRIRYIRTEVIDRPILVEAASQEAADQYLKTENNWHEDDALVSDFNDGDETSTVVDSYNVIGFKHIEKLDQISNMCNPEFYPWSVHNNVATKTTQDILSQKA